MLMYYVLFLLVLALSLLLSYLVNMLQKDRKSIFVKVQRVTVIVGQTIKEDSE
jgi:hypothetical protein